MRENRSTVHTIHKGLFPIFKLSRYISVVTQVLYREISDAKVNISYIPCIKIIK